MKKHNNIQVLFLVIFIVGFVFLITQNSYGHEFEDYPIVGYSKEKYITFFYDTNNNNIGDTKVTFRFINGKMIVIDIKKVSLTPLVKRK